jgi:PilZ domain
MEHVSWQYRVALHKCRESAAAQRLCAEKELDLLVADFDNTGIDDVLAAWGDRGPNASHVVIAFGTGERINHQRQKHFHFMMQKPLSSALVARTLKFACTIWLKKQRADYRVSINSKAELSLWPDGLKQATTRVSLLDISRGGICLKADSPIEKSSSVQVTFCLPESPDIIHARGAVTWAEASGLTGIRFSSIPPQEQRALETWLEQRDPSRPGQIASVLSGTTLPIRA